MHTDSETGKVRKVVFSTVIGGMFEWFDFMMYGYFSNIIAQVFFAGINGNNSLLLTFATFAVGFLARPIGGVVMGMYADRAGRVKALSWIMVAMSAGSLLLGLTPGFATLGIAAPILVAIGRLVQGFAVGGQFALSSVTIYEVAPAGKKMFYGSFNRVSQGIAEMLASGGSFLLSQHLPQADMEMWGWRVPFLIGALVGPIGIYIRHHIGESDEFHRIRTQPAVRAPAAERIRAFVRENGDAVVCAIGVMMAGTSLGYVWNAYLPTYAQTKLHLPLSSSLQAVFVTSIMSCVLSPIFGKLADRVGPYRLFCFFIASWLTCVFPLFWYLLAEPTTARLMVVQSIGMLFLAMQGSAHSGMLVKIFTVQGRSTGVAISYNTAVMLFGGLAPFYISAIDRFTNSLLIAPAYLVCTSLLAISLVLLTRTGRRMLREDRSGRGIHAELQKDHAGKNGATASDEQICLRQ